MTPRPTPGAISRRQATVLVTFACVLLAGCTGEQPRQPAGQQRPHHGGVAAEPADSPEQLTRPAGRVVRIGARPEGLAVDPRSHTLAIAVREPSRLLLVDGETGRTGNTVRLPGTVRHLQLAKPGGPFLVPEETSDQLASVGVNGQVVSRLNTGDSPHDATMAKNGTVFVANEKGGDVAAVRDGRVVKRFPSPQPGGLAAAGSTVAAVDVADYTLTVYDPEGLREVGELPVGRGPTHIVADKADRYNVVDTRGGELLRFASDPGLAERLRLPGSPYGMAYDRKNDRLWITLTARNEVVAVDLGDPEGATREPGEEIPKPRVTHRLPTVRQPNTVAVDSSTGRVYVGGASAGELQLIDP